MSSAGISFGGLASGLDTQAIISALLSIEERPIFALERKKTSISREKSLFGDLNGLLDKLTDAAKTLKTANTFLQMTASSDNEDILTASADSSATPGTYTAKVEQLARAQLNSAGYSTPDGQIGTGGTPVSFLIDNGSGTFVISASPNLQAIADAINAEDDANDLGVRAEVIDTQNPDPTERYQLVIRGSETGSENAFSITYDDGPPEFDALITELNTNQTDALDARLNVGGIDVFRPTNTITDLWGGITLELKSVVEFTPGEYEEVTVTVATDGEETSAKVRELVDAYNAVVDFFEAQNALDEEGQANSPLFGDTTLRSIRSNLRGIVGDAIGTSGNEAYQLLSQIGITADTKGKLTFEQSKFEEALATDENAVTAIFTEAAEGIAGRLEDQIDLYTDSVDGLIKTRNDGFDRLIKQTQNRIEAAERRLAQYEQQLVTKYANLETLLARLQGQGSSVGNIAQSFGNN